MVLFGVSLGAEVRKIVVGGVPEDRYVLRGAAMRQGYLGG